LAFGPIGVDIVAVERDRSVDQAEDRCVVIGVRRRRIDILKDSRLGFPRQRLAVGGVDLERLLEQWPRCVNLVLAGQRQRQERPPAHRQIDGVRILHVGRLRRFGHAELVAQGVGQLRHHLILQLEQIRHVHLEPVGPDVGARFGVDQSRVGPHPILVALH
jgi:hypothetical protein